MNYGLIIEVASYIVAGASVALAGISVLTKNTVDDKILKVVNKIKSILGLLSINVKK